MFIKVTALITSRGEANIFTRQGSPVFINSEHIVCFQKENNDTVVYLVDGTRIVVHEDATVIAATLGYQAV